MILLIAWTVKNLSINSNKICLTPEIFQPVMDLYHNDNSIIGHLPKQIRVDNNLLFISMVYSSQDSSRAGAIPFLSIFFSIASAVWKTMDSATC